MDVRWTLFWRRVLAGMAVLKFFPILVNIFCILSSSCKINPNWPIFLRIILCPYTGQHTRSKIEYLKPTGKTSPKTDLLTQYKLHLSSLRWTLLQTVKILGKMRENGIWLWLIPLFMFIGLFCCCPKLSHSGLIGWISFVVGFISKLGEVLYWWLYCKTHFHFLYRG